MRRIISLGIIICMLLSFPIASSAASVSDFNDVSQNDWFYSSVDFVTQNGMFNGTAANTFSPASTMTRGMFVTVLGRYGGVKVPENNANYGVVTHTDVRMRSLPTTEGSVILETLPINTNVEVYQLIDDTSANGYTWYYVKYNGVLGYIRSDLMAAVLNSFTDVSDSAYYKPYVMWACSSFVASPTGENTFSPDRDITREEICSMLYNFAYIQNYQLKPTVSFKSFHDSGSVSSEYADAVLALQQTGVINGYDDGSFRPGGSATRAEVSTMLMRFVDALGYHPSTEASTDASGNYIFGTAVPVAPAVGLDYFSDACFIGHSLIVGTKNYSGIDNADYFAFNGASTTSLLNRLDFPLSSTHIDENGNSVADKGSLGQALSEKSYGKVYIMLGVNEIGSGSYHQQNFYNNISTMINLVRKSQPNAKVYLISLTPVSKEQSESSKSINRDNIIAFNDVLKRLCADKQTYYLNIFDLFADGGGFLPEASNMGDGIHISGSSYTQLKDYLSTHTIG